MTRPLAPNSMTIEPGDPTKIRAIVADFLQTRSPTWLAGKFCGMDGDEILLGFASNGDFLSGYFAGCDARRGIVR